MLIYGVLYYLMQNAVQQYFLNSSEAVVRRCSVKKVFLKISQNSQVFSCRFCRILKNTFFHKTPLEAASHSLIINRSHPGDTKIKKSPFSVKFIHRICSSKLNFPYNNWWWQFTCNEGWRDGRLCPSLYLVVIKYQVNTGRRTLNQIHDFVNYLL